MQIKIFGLSRESFKDITRILTVSWYDDLGLDEFGEISVKVSDNTKLYFGNNEIMLSIDGYSVNIDRNDYKYIKIE